MLALSQPGVRIGTPSRRRPLPIWPAATGSDAQQSLPETVLLPREHQPRDQRRRLFLHRGDGVRVGIERDRDGGVAETLTDHLGVHAGLQGQGGMGVAQVVQADRRQHRPLHRLPPVAGDRLGVEGGAVLGREHEAALDPALVPFRLLLELTGGLGLQDLDGDRVEGD